MSDLTRDALIDAAAKATFERQHAADIAASTDIDWRWETLLPDTRDVWRKAVTPALDAVLSLIADAIEAKRCTGCGMFHDGSAPIRLVFSLMGDDGPFTDRRRR